MKTKTVLKKLLKIGSVLALLLGLVIGVVWMSLPEGLDGTELLKALYNPRKAAFGEKDSLTLLLLGVDYNYDKKAQRHTNGARSDTMLIVRVEPRGEELSMMSIPRDLLVGIGGDTIHGYDKINSAHSIGGSKMAIETIERVTGMEIDHHVVVKSDVVEDLVDTIGGVPVDVEKQMDWDDNWAGLHIHLSPGKQVLSGSQAVGYCRFRADGEGDFGRMRRQQQFVTALLKELKSKRHVPKYGELAKVMAAKMKTDLTKDQLLGLAVTYKDFPIKNIRKGRPEVEDYWSRGLSYLVLAPGEPGATIKKLFPPLKDSTLLGVRVVIENHGVPKSEVRRVASAFRNSGFSGVRTTHTKTTGSESGETEVEFLGGNDAAAKVVRSMFPKIEVTRKAKDSKDRIIVRLRDKVYVRSAEEVPE